MKSKLIGTLPATALSAKLLTLTACALLCSVAPSRSDPIEPGNYTETGGLTVLYNQNQNLPGGIGVSTPLPYPGNDPTLTPYVSTSVNGLSLVTSMFTPYGQADAHFSLLQSVQANAFAFSYFDPILGIQSSGFATAAANMNYYAEIILTDPHGPTFPPVPVRLTASGSVSYSNPVDGQGNNAILQVAGLTAGCFGVAHSSAANCTGGGNNTFSVDTILNFIPYVLYPVTLEADAAAGGNLAGGSSFAVVDPTFAFAPGFDATGYSLVFSPGIVNNDVPGATPLPSTWTMLIAGFVGLGFLAYRGKKSTAAAALRA
jgi:hypothetical protein